MAPVSAVQSLNCLVILTTAGAAITPRRPSSSQGQSIRIELSNRTLITLLPHLPHLVLTGAASQLGSRPSLASQSVRPIPLSFLSSPPKVSPVVSFSSPSLEPFSVAAAVIAASEPPTSPQNELSSSHPLLVHLPLGTLIRGATPYKAALFKATFNSYPNRPTSPCLALMVWPSRMSTTFKSPMSRSKGSTSESI